MTEPSLAPRGAALDGRWVAVALTQHGRHAGLLMEDPGEDPYFAHIKGHLDLTTQHAPGDLRWVIPALSNNELSRVWFLVRQILDQAADNQVPFGFRYRNAAFIEDGRLIMEPGGGLSCSSFVVLVFHSVGLPLVREETWMEAGEERRAEDRIRREGIITFIRNEYPGRATELEAELDEPICIRPVEVAAASGMTPRPVVFADAEVAGRWIEEQLTSS